MSNPSYHDVVVFVNDDKYELFNSPYGLRLECTRCGGWQLWFKPDGRDQQFKLIGGEYDSDNFRIEVRGQVVCQSG